MKVEPGTEELLGRAGSGDRSAVERLLGRHRRRLRSFAASRIDRRTAARVDPSDIVQEALGDACRYLPAFLRDRPLPFFLWLRRLAFQRLIGSRRAHVGSRMRSVVREQVLEAARDDEPRSLSIDRLACPGPGPFERAAQREEVGRIMPTLHAMHPIDREILELRYLRERSFDQIAQSLGIGLGAAKMRHLRALERIRDRLGREVETSA